MEPEGFLFHQNGREAHYPSRIFNTMYDEVDLRGYFPVLRQSKNREDRLTLVTNNEELVHAVINKPKGLAITIRGTTTVLGQRGSAIHTMIVLDPRVNEEFKMPRIEYCDSGMIDYTNMRRSNKTMLPISNSATMTNVYQKIARDALSRRYDKSELDIDSITHCLDLEQAVNMNSI